MRKKYCTWKGQKFEYKKTANINKIELISRKQIDGFEKIKDKNDNSIWMRYLIVNKAEELFEIGFFINDKGRNYEIYLEEDGSWSIVKNKKKEKFPVRDFKNKGFYIYHLYPDGNKNWFNRVDLWEFLNKINEIFGDDFAEKNLVFKEIVNNIQKGDDINE